MFVWMLYHLCVVCCGAVLNEMQNAGKMWKKLANNQLALIKPWFVLILLSLIANTSVHNILDVVKKCVIVSYCTFVCAVAASALKSNCRTLLYL